MTAEFVVQQSNIEATALLLVMNGTAGFEKLSTDEAQQKLIRNIERSYLNAVNELGVDRVLNRESAWPCWKGVTCCYLPFSSGAGYRPVFEADAGTNHLVQVVLYTTLDMRDLDALSGKVSK